MQRILCYGDSLTWGYKPGTEREQIEKEKRWTGVLQKLLGNSSQIMVDALNGRTLDSEDTRLGKEGRNGAETLEIALNRYKPIDIFILMLGTNELKDCFNRDLKDISAILDEKYIKKIKKPKYGRDGKTPSILIISPPDIDITKKHAYERHSHLGNKLVMMREIYSKVAKINSCAYLDSSIIAYPGNDGVHIDEKEHKKLGEAIYMRVKELAI